MMKKKFFKYIPLILGLAVAFSSCSDDDDDDLNDNPTVPKPTIEISVNGDLNQSSYEVMQGSDINFGLTAMTASGGGAKLDEAKFTQSGANAQGGFFTMTSSNGKEYDFGQDFIDVKNADNEKLIFTEKFSDITASTGVTSYEFTIKDKDGLIASASFDINVITATPFDTTKTGEIWHIKGLKKGSWSLTDDIGISASNADNEADITNTNDAQETFDGAFEVGANRTNTSFVKASPSFDYANATMETAKAAYQAGTPATSEAAPQEDDVFVFNLDGDYAVVKVLVVDPTASCGASCNNPGKMTFEYKK